jgi:hypothetical protein
VNRVLKKRCKTAAGNTAAGLQAEAWHTHRIRRTRVNLSTTRHPPEPVLCLLLVCLRLHLRRRQVGPVHRHTHRLHVCQQCTKGQPGAAVHIPQRLKLDAGLNHRGVAVIGSG